MTWLGFAGLLIFGHREALLCMIRLGWAKPSRAAYSMAKAWLCIIRHGVVMARYGQGYSVALLWLWLAGVSRAGFWLVVVRVEDGMIVLNRFINGSWL